MPVLPCFARNFRYNKTENLPPGGDDMMQFTHLLLGISSAEGNELAPYVNTHNQLAAIDAFSRISLNLRKFPPISVTVSPRIYLLKRKLRLE
jgi:alpha-1,6-mannosyltransferase